MNSSPILLVRRGDQTRQIVLLDGAAMIGSAPDNHIVLERGDVAGRHGRILRINGSLRIADLGSPSGTRLNGAPLPPRTPVPFEAGDTIRIGAYTLTLKPGDRAAEPDAVAERLGAAGAVTVADPPPLPSERGQTVVLPAWPDGERLAPELEPPSAPPSFDLRGRERVLIGRLPANDLVLDHPAISRFHARITRGGVANPVAADAEGAIDRARRAR